MVQKVKKVIKGLEKASKSHKKQAEMLKNTLPKLKNQNQKAGESRWQLL